MRKLTLIATMSLLAGQAYAIQTATAETDWIASLRSQ